MTREGSNITTAAPWSNCGSSLFCKAAKQMLTTSLGLYLDEGIWPFLTSILLDPDHGFTNFPVKYSSKFGSSDIHVFVALNGNIWFFKKYWNERIQINCDKIKRTVKGAIILVNISFKYCFISTLHVPIKYAQILNELLSKRLLVHLLFMVHN